MKLMVRPYTALKRRMTRRQVRNQDRAGRKEGENPEGSQRPRERSGSDRRELTLSHVPKRSDNNFRTGNWALVWPDGILSEREGR